MKPGVYVTHSLVLNESWCMSRSRWLWCMSRIPWSWMSSGVCHALFGLGWVLVYVTHSLVLNESQCMSRPRWSWMSSGVCHAFLGLEWVLVYVMDESWKMSHIPWSCNLKVSNLRAVTVNPKLERVPLRNCLPMVCTFFKLNRTWAGYGIVCPWCGTKHK